MADICEVTVENFKNCAGVANSNENDACKRGTGVADTREPETGVYEISAYITDACAGSAAVCPGVPDFYRFNVITTFRSHLYGNCRKSNYEKDGEFGS